MDIFELVSKSEIRAAVLGRGEEFLLVCLDKEYPGKERDIECAIARGLLFCGVLGWSWSSGKMFAALEQDPDTLAPMRLATASFGAIVGRMAAPSSPTLERVQPGDSLAWLERLRALPDTRD